MPRSRTRIPSSCQLCDWNNTHRHPGGHIPTAVTKMDGIRICAKHVRLIHAIARAAGVSTAHLPQFQEVA